ncbi:HalOD1 output domain-containing protein [Haladaptatus sp. NG-SE-30]
MKEDKLAERMPDLDDGEYEAYRIEDSDDDVSTRIIRGVEELVGTSNNNDTWLYDSIDPDALDSIFDHKHDGTPRNDGKVVFVAHGCEIHAHASGEIVVHVSKADADE